MVFGGFKWVYGVLFYVFGGFMVVFVVVLRQSTRVKLDFIGGGKSD